MDYRTDVMKVELYTNFLYPGMMLKGDAYDEKERLVIPENTSLTREMIDHLIADGVKKVHYSREKLRLKKDVTRSMISDEKVQRALNVIDDIQGAIRTEGAKSRIPSREVTEVVDGFINDIRGNSDAYLNLLDLFHMSDYTYTHSINVSTISVLLGMSLKLDEDKIRILGISGLLHDLGKSMITDTIMDKPSGLDEEEWKIVKNHPVYSYNILHAQNEFHKAVETSVLCHHEDYAGGGYPFGVGHDKQTTFSQALSLADVFDAATSKRPYKDANAFSETFTFFMENSGKKFHPSITQVFLRDMAKKINEEPIYPEKSFVLLNTGEIGQVIGHRISPFTLRPIVNIMLTPSLKGKALENMIRHPLQIDLETDYNRHVIRRITDCNQLEKLNMLCLG